MSNQEQEFELDTAYQQWRTTERFKSLVVDVSGQELLAKTRHAIKYNQAWQDSGYRGLPHAYETLQACHRLDEKELQLAEASKQSVTKLGLFGRMFDNHPENEAKQNTILSPKSSKRR